MRGEKPVDQRRIDRCLPQRIERRYESMPEKASVMIDTVPLPERLMTVDIPKDLLQEFQEDLRFIVKYPWPIGIPVPDRMLDPKILGRLKDFDVMLVPRQMLR
jgi:hypothetical protein